MATVRVKLSGFGAELGVQLCDSVRIRAGAWIWVTALRSGLWLDVGLG